MKKNYLNLFIAICFVFLSLTGFGQTVLKGVVTASGDNSTLPSANVVIKGTTIGTTTNLDGEYRLDLKPGSYSIVASFIGFEPKEELVEITKGETKVLDFVLGNKSILGEEVVVTAQMLGQKAAINQQLNASGIVNVVSEKQIQELPDANAAESLGRLPGISLKRSGGEAQKIVVRGLNEKFSLITLNGVPIPSTDANSRGVDLSLFSQSSLAGIEVTKAITSDQDADAIAGSVNLVTKKASKDREFRIDLGGGYNKLENSLGQYRLDVKYGQRFFRDKLGVQASVNAERLIRSGESFSQKWDIEADSSYEISNLSLNYTKELRKRTGGSLLLDLSTSDGGTIRINNFYNRTDRDKVNFGRNYPTTGDVNYSFNDSERQIYSINNSITGDNFYNLIEINWGLSHAYSVNQQPYGHELNFIEGGSTGSGMKNVEVKDLQGPGDRLISYAYNNFSSAYLRRADFETNDNEDRDLIAQINLKRLFKLSDQVNITVKAGVKHRKKTRSRDIDAQWATYWVTKPKTFVQLDNGSIVPEDLSGTSFEDIQMVGGTTVSMMNFLSAQPESRSLFGKYDLNPMIQPDLAREWYNLRQNSVNRDGTLAEYTDNLIPSSGIYSVTERITAGYAMTNFELGKMITVIAGLRIEQENNDYNAKYAPELSGFLTFDPSQISDTSSSYKQHYILPNFHFRFKPTNWFDIRLAATKSISRPDFSMRLPRLFINRVDKTISRGNPLLKTTEAWNYDVIASMYKSKYGLFTVGAFMKELDNIFYNIEDLKILSSEYGDSIGLPQGVGTFNGFEITEPINTMGTKVYGLELDLQANLSFLPSIFGNLVLRGNYTILKSETYIPRYRVEQSGGFPPKQSVVRYNEKNKLEGQPNTFGNVMMGYDDGSFSARLSVYFQDDYLTSITGNGLRDSYQKGYSKWDLALKQKFKNFDVMVNVKNLSDMHEGTFYELKGLDRGSSKYDLFVDFGVRINL